MTKGYSFFPYTKGNLVQRPQRLQGLNHLGQT